MILIDKIQKHTQFENLFVLVIGVKHCELRDFLRSFRDFLRWFHSPVIGHEGAHFQRIRSLNLDTGEGNVDTRTEQQL